MATQMYRDEFAERHIIEMRLKTAVENENRLRNYDLKSNEVTLHDNTFFFEGDGNLWAYHIPTKVATLQNIANASPQITMRNKSSMHESLRLVGTGCLELTHFLPDRKNCLSVVVTLYRLHPQFTETRIERMARLKNERIKKMREEDAKCSTLACRYTRACVVCATENPRRRAFLVQCGHIICNACAEQMAELDTDQFDCPICRTETGFKTMFEDEKTEVEEEEDDGEQGSKSTTSTQTDPIEVVPRNEVAPSRQTAPIPRVSFSVYQEYSPIEYALRDMSMSGVLMVFCVFCLMLCCRFFAEN